MKTGRVTVTTTRAILTARARTLTSGSLRSRSPCSSVSWRAEVTAGIVASSLALLSDAAHMLTDAAAIGLSLVVGLAQRPAPARVCEQLVRSAYRSQQQRGRAVLLRERLP